VNDLDLHLFSKPFPKFYAMKPGFLIDRRSPMVWEGRGG